MQKEETLPPWGPGRLQAGRLVNLCAQRFSEVAKEGGGSLVSAHGLPVSSLNAWACAPHSLEPRDGCWPLRTLWRGAVSCPLPAPGWQLPAPGSLTSEEGGAARGSDERQSRAPRWCQRSGDLASLFITLCSLPSNALHTAFPPSRPLAPSPLGAGGAADRVHWSTGRVFLST